MMPLMIAFVAMRLKAKAIVFIDPSLRLIVASVPTGVLPAADTAALALR